MLRCKQCCEGLQKERLDELTSNFGLWDTALHRRAKGGRTFKDVKFREELIEIKNFFVSNSQV